MNGPGGDAPRKSSVVALMSEAQQMPPPCKPEELYGPFPNLTLMYNRITALALAVGVIWAVRAGLSTRWWVAALLTIAPAIGIIAQIRKMESSNSTGSLGTHAPDTHAPGTHSPDTHAPGTHSPDTRDFANMDPEERRVRCNLQSGMEYALLYAYLCAIACLAGLVYAVRYAMRGTR
jgi:hypothetical protein